MASRRQQTMFIPAVVVRCLTSTSSLALILSQSVTVATRLHPQNVRGSLVIYGDAFYQNVKTHNELAPSATGSFFTPRSGDFGDSAEHAPEWRCTPKRRIYRAEAQAAYLAKMPRMSRSMRSTPSIRSIRSSRVAARARLAEFGNRLFDNDSDAFLATLGVRGDKLFDGNWGYDFGYPLQPDQEYLDWHFGFHVALQPHPQRGMTRSSIQPPISSSERRFRTIRSVTYRVPIAQIQER